jgi:cell division initiation protein
MDVTPQSIRAVQFREKLRGYHPDDVDAFVASVAKGVEELEQRAKQAEARLAELESRQSASSEAEDSLRRTLVLAQRTADAAIQEAREEAARVMAEANEQRATAEAEVGELRARLHAEAEAEGRGERERLSAERAALAADVDALRTHLERERERLRIYFADQLRRVDEGDPSVAPSPAMQAEPDEQVVAEAEAEAEAGDGEAVDAGEPTGEVEAVDAVEAAPETEDDPFLAELRRAVTDDKPLGPREDEPRAEAPADGEEADDGFDLFAKGDEDPGRFGSRLRRRR